MFWRSPPNIEVFPLQGLGKSESLLQVVMTVPGLRHVLDNGTIIFPPFPATDLEPSLHSQGLCPDSDLTVSFIKKKLKREESRDLLYSLDTVYTQEYRCAISNTAGTILSRLARVRAGESPVYCVLCTVYCTLYILQYTL